MRGVDLELALVLAFDVPTREGDPARAIEHFEVLGIEPDGDRAIGKMGGDGVRRALDPDRRVGADLTHGVLVNGKARLGEPDQKVALREPDLVGDETRGSMNAAVGDVVEPVAHALVEILEARELGAADAAVLEEA